MADIKSKAEEDKEGDPASDRPWCLQNLPSPTVQSKATGLSSDSEYRPFNGPQPEPASPSGEIINGSPSHSTREGQPQLLEDTDGDSTSGSGPNSPEDTPQLSPKFPTGPQLDKISSGKDRVTEEILFVKTKPPYIKAEEASASEAASESDHSDFELPRQEVPRNRSLNEPTGQNRVGKGGTGARSLWDFGSESSESSSEDCEEDLTWEPQSEFMHFLMSSPKKTEPSPPSQSRRKRKLNAVDRAGDGGFVPLAKQSLTYDCSDDNDMVVSKEHNIRRKPNAKSPVVPHLDCSDGAEDMKEHFMKRKCHEGTDTESAKPNHVSAELVSDPDGEPLFFPCTKCNVNFKEKAHLHRHMLHHQAPPNVNVPRPYICRECGRSFRDGSALQKHMVIHQARRERLMEEIKGLSELQDEGRQARLQCPQCVFGTDCAKTFVQHAKTHEKDKRYYCCESCSHMAATPQELEAHRCTAHHTNNVSTHARHPGGREDVKTGTNRITLLHCNICPFSTQNRNILKKHTELIHRQPYFGNEDDEDEGKPVSRVAEPNKLGLDLRRLTSQAKPGNSRLSQLKPKLNSETPAERRGGAPPVWSGGIADLCVQNRVSQKARKGFSLPLFKWTFGGSTNKLSSSLPRLDKPSKLSPPPTARIDVTRSLLHDEEGNQKCAGLRPEDREKTKHTSDSEAYSDAKTDRIHQNHKCDPNSDIPSGRELLFQPVPHRTLSKRKMSIPYHNTLKPKAEPISPVLTEDEEEEDDDDEEDDEYDDEEDSLDFRDYSSTFLDSSESQRNHFMSTKPLYLPRSRLPIRKDILHSNGSEDEEESDCDDIHDLIIKEECEETAVSLDVPSAESIHGSFSERQGPPAFTSDRKSCPYCPALFESGVGLSNHVRGHLHRVGLSYDARHMVSPEQVASQDRQPRIRRKAPSTNSRRLKKVDKPESQTEHTCPLCWGWFDTRTGLSNHVRGHLKRIGRGLGSGDPGSSTRSPLCILNELLRDKTEHRSLLGLLGRRPSHTRPFVSQKFAGSDGLFLTPTGIPIKVQHSRAQVGVGGGGESKSRLWFGEERTESKRREKKVEEEEIRVEDHGGVDGAPSSTLVELLRRRKQEQEMRERHQTHARRQLPISPARESVARLAVLKPDPGWSQGKTDVKKVCIHCNATFHSAVSLSNHLRAYARRKRAALLEGTTYDCKQKKPRSRPGPKKKMFSLPHSPEEIYRLTCRFCDLVFQGPLSVQEDWIKHLQRHLMHTSVPHTGAAMVEVTAVCKELPPPPPPERLVLPRQHTPLQVPPTVS
ncbi:zinc finger protein 644 isoform X2 [Clupea harengus]|uniref:Zinc finger protein 644 isoform X2 n=1 Tax=Clupea harengus TaxID=7950 RepID=A0A6P8FTE9_CLUHA|nr:zinc finger protein 644 isoform X2 [Clupea harengus]